MQRQVGFWCGWSWWSYELYQLFSKLGRLFVIIDQSFVKRKCFTDNAMGDREKARGSRENVLFHHIGRWPHASMGFGGYAMSKLDINISVKPRIVDYTVLVKRVRYFVLLNYSWKSWLIFKTSDRFGICWSWGFQNTPYMCNFTKFSLRYLRLKTHGTILLFSW